MKVKVPKTVEQIILNIGNKTRQKSALKIWATLIINSKRKNPQGYFEIPSTLLEAINKRYKEIITAFVDAKIIKPYTRPRQSKTSIFESEDIRYYNRQKHICMSYKILINSNTGTEYEIDMKTHRKERWYKIIEDSMTELKFEGKIFRDTFGRRVHHPIIPVYKEALIKKGFALIDAKCSQPKLLLNIMKERGIIDSKYEEAFEVDFYEYVVQALNLTDRKSAKDLFMYWINSSGYVPDYKIHKLFPAASEFIKELKNKYYKDAGSYLQRIEAKIWIDDLLNNIPTDFALPVHDCLIVKDKEVYSILNYCKSRYKDIEFQVSFL